MKKETAGWKRLVAEGGPLSGFDVDTGPAAGSLVNHFAIGHEILGVLFGDAIHLRYRLRGHHFRVANRRPGEHTLAFQPPNGTVASGS
jgi:hypothetical protein